jgi:hypothetical protein
VTAEGLVQIRTRVQAKKQRKALLEYQTDALHKTPEAAKKWRQRREKRGEDPQAMAKALRSKRDRTVVPDDISGQ